MIIITIPNNYTTKVAPFVQNLISKNTLKFVVKMWISYLSWAKRDNPSVITVRRLYNFPDKLRQLRMGATTEVDLKS